MKIAILFAAAAMLVAGTALASSKTFLGQLDHGESTVKQVTLHKGTTDILITPDHENRVSCQFIDVKAGNVVVLQQDNNQMCSGTSVNDNDVIMAVNITNPNDGYMNFEMKITPRN